MYRSILCLENSECVISIMKILERIKKYMTPCLLPHSISLLVSMSQLCADGIRYLGYLMTSCHYQVMVKQRQEALGTYLENLGPLYQSSHKEQVNIRNWAKVTSILKGEFPFALYLLLWHNFSLWFIHCSLRYSNKTSCSAHTH